MLGTCHDGLDKTLAKEESKMLREERGQNKFIDLRFESLQGVEFRKGRRRQHVA